MGMEFFVAESKHSKDVCLREVDNADLILLIVTDNYGTIDTETGKSFTHLEFNRAKDGNREILAFLQKNPKDGNVQSFQNEIQGSRVTPDYFDNVSDIQNVLWPALFKYVIKEGLIKNKTRTFNSFTQFYARSLEEHSLFNYRQKLVGRQKELAQLEQYLKDDKQRVIIIQAAGGMGKSKLIYEFVNKNLIDSGWNFRFVPWQVNFDNDSIGELPAQNTCVVIEDAHKQKNLDTLIYSLLHCCPVIS